MSGSVVWVLVATLTAVVLLAFIVARTWHGIAARRAELAKATDGQYRRLAGEYSRIAEMAVTAQEHTDHKLEDITMRIDELRGQLESVQQILKEVE